MKKKDEKTDDKSHGVIWVSTVSGRTPSKRPYFASVLHSHRAACEPANLRFPLVRSLLPCLLPSGDLTVTLLFSFFVFSISILDVVLFHPVYCCLLDFCFDSFSVGRSTCLIRT